MAKKKIVIPLGLIAGYATGVVLFPFMVVFMLIRSWIRGALSPVADSNKPADFSKTDFTISVGVAGESHENPDGTSRQSIIKNKCKAGDAIILRPESDNLYDEYAVAVVHAPTGLQLGYLPADMEIGYEAQPITHYVCENFNTVGWQYVANIKAIVGGTTGKPSVGVVLRLGIIKPQLAKKRR